MVQPTLFSRQMERLKPGDAKGSLKGSQGLVVFKDNLLMRLLLGQILARVSSGELEGGQMWALKAPHSHLGSLSRAFSQVGGACH